MNEFVECKKHDWIYERGCAVCRECGLVDDENLQLVRSSRQFQDVKIRRYKSTSDTKRIIRLDKRIKYQLKKNYLLNGLLDVLSKIDISMEQKQLIINHVNKLRPKGWKDVFDYFILTIIKFEFPITNKALLRVINNLYTTTKEIAKKSFEGFKYKQRSYEWYIWKILSKFDFLSNEEMTEIYKRARKQYLFVIGKTIGIDPTALIGVLCYHIIRELYGNKDKNNYISTQKRSVRHFNTNLESYYNYKEKGYLDD